MPRTKRSLSVLALVLASVTASCISQPETYAPPVQRKPLSIEEPGTLKAFINMNDPDARLHFVKGVRPSLEGGVWRWTEKNPVLLFVVPTNTGYKFAADITLPDLTFKDTGPVTITTSVNGHQLDSTHYETPGYKHIEKPVPPDWLHPRAENLVSMEVDKVWVAPADKVTLGFVLTRAGFIH